MLWLIFFEIVTTFEIYKITEHSFSQFGFKSDSSNTIHKSDISFECTADICWNSLFNSVTFYVNTNWFQYNLRIGGPRKKVNILYMYFFSPYKEKNMYCGQRIYGGVGPRKRSLFSRKPLATSSVPIGLMVKTSI